MKNRIKDVGKQKKRLNNKMLKGNNHKGICSVTELAKRLGMSRARFYQLKKIGVFPPPVYCIFTKRPFYTHQLQQQCITIRKTGLGFNGKIAIFYSARKKKSANPLTRPDHMYHEFASVLRQMGLNVAKRKVKIAAKHLYPQGIPAQADEGTVIMNIYRYLNTGA